MAQTHDSGRVGQPFNVGNQMMCALIGLGYQCRAFILDAWHFGAPQDRIRLFIEIAAPGCTLPGIPPGSHAHPLYAKGRSVGKTSANIKFAARDLDLLTSFPPVKLRDSWDDLPSIGNGHLGVCIPYPDHKVPWTMNARDRGIAAVIPVSDSLFRHPDYRYALRSGLVPQHLKLPTSRNENSRRFQRLAADRNVPTVTCSMNPISEICGRTLHYSENRPFSILEAKRLQGFLDTDVLVGKPRSAIKIIGNSVCRQVAFALGEKLAEAVGSGYMGSGAEAPVKDVLKTEEKLDCTNMKMEISRPPSRKFMVMIEQKRPRQGIAASKPAPKISTNKDKVSYDTTVNLTAAENNDKIGISLISHPRRKHIRIQVGSTWDQDM
jgi:site-specific DNA-cytosine methylase